MPIDQTRLSRLLRRACDLRSAFTAVLAVEELRAELRDLESIAVREAIAQGARKSDLADALGITRQALHYRLTKDRDRSQEDGKGPRGGPSRRTA